MPVDAQVQLFLDLLASVGGPKTAVGTPEEARAGYAQMLAQPPVDDSTGPIASAEDRSIEGPAGPLPVRVYRPRRVGVLPTVVFFHGGGWVIGSVATHDGQARQLCEGTGAVVVSVDYRLAPEYPFPAALDDCAAATHWAAAHIDELGGKGGALAVAGDSAGGNLAAAVALRALDRGGPRLTAQLLIYPALDASRSTASYAENASGFFLEADTMRWFWGHYLGGSAATPESSVIDAADLSGLPPAVIVTAEYDPLRDEGNAYAARLAEAGVPVTLVECPGLIHGFFAMTTYVEAAAKASAHFLSDFSALLEAVEPRS